MTAFRSCPDCKGLGRIEIQCQLCRGKGSIDQLLTDAEKAALKVAARYILDSHEPPDFWAMNGHEMNALHRAMEKL